MEQIPLVGSNATTACDFPGACCLALATILGQDKVSFPDTPAYEASQGSYFAQQNSALQPSCVVFPDSADEVSNIITSILAISSGVPDYEKAGCQFAIRSGGHNSFGGASNIHNGVTIDLRALNTIQVQEAPTENDEDESAQNKEAQHTVFVGAGATWGEVYALLDPLGLSVAGGRAAQVGVGGLTLGGGISYFSPRYGWTCDNLVGAEVVLANGTIVYLDEGQHSDWLAALRGGGANFGVVTGFNLQTFPQGPIYGGSIYHSTETIDAQLRAFAELADPKASSYDEYASLITSFGFAGGQGAAIVNSVVQLSVVATHDVTLPMLNATYLRWNSNLEAVQDIPGIVWSISLEPLPPAIYARAPPDHNVMGLSSSERLERSLVVTLLSATWDDAADDARVEEAAKVLFSGIESDAHALDAYHPFVYLNYAAQWQDPIASYGPESIERLRRISREVDPTGVFQNMVPGGFKIQQ
ncbi:uncharacterized protein An11g07510 [Aspergillus niger]|uniref:Contig An11c0260, genomic contig n=2 Tax=Aspergillus niger TaxID=5061 RepID=A2QX39_ASPNC|nr:uncharacterized protein An11g07510 [Aspergillus niger]CAK40795.1 unnamed protein product [Aspergillus niger]